MPTDGQIRILLVDNHDVVREGLRQVLGVQEDFTIVGEARDGEEGLALLESMEVDVVVMDYRLPGMNAAEVCREIAERRLLAEVVVLSWSMQEEGIVQVLRAGARAYVLKDADTQELERAIRAAARGNLSLDPKLTGRFMRWATRLDGIKDPVLSDSQAELLRHLVAGKTLEDICRLQSLSLQTVQSYLRVIYRHLGVNTRAAAVSVALRRGVA